MKFLKIAAPLGLVVLTIVSQKANAVEFSRSESTRTASPIRVESIQPATPAGSSFGLQGNGSDPGLEDSITCTGLNACAETLVFCDGVHGGMSQNPDGSQTCTYDPANVPTGG